eukprot:3090759-Pyramimonas_sp.AAC.2
MARASLARCGGPCELGFKSRIRIEGFSAVRSIQRHDAILLGSLLSELLANTAKEDFSPHTLAALLPYSHCDDRVFYVFPPYARRICRISHRIGQRCIYPRLANTNT